MINCADSDQQKPNDVDIYCLQRQGISGFSRTRVKKKISRALLNMLDIDILMIFVN